MRFELSIRDQISRKHIKTVTVECELEDILNSLTLLRQPVLNDIEERILNSLKNKQIKELKGSDFFDSKGSDINYEEFYINERAEIVD